MEIAHPPFSRSSVHPELAVSAVAAKQEGAMIPCGPDAVFHLWNRVHGTQRLPWLLACYDIRELVFWSSNKGGVGPSHASQLGIFNSQRIQSRSPRVGTL
jgi:hypothetical protein